MVIENGGNSNRDNNIILFCTIKNFSPEYKNEVYRFSDKSTLINGILSDIAAVIKKNYGDVEQAVSNNLIACWREQLLTTSAILSLHAVRQSLRVFQKRYQPEDGSCGLSMGIWSGPLSQGEINTGGESLKTLTGEPLTRAQKLATSAAPGGVYLDGKICNHHPNQELFKCASVEFEDFESPVCEFRPAQADQVKATPDSGHLFDRTEERDRLKSHLQMFSSGRHQLPGVVVHGVAGIGKSYLCEHVLGSEEPGFKILRGVCPPGALNLQGGLVAGWLIELLGGTDRTHLDEFLQQNSEFDDFEEDLWRILKQCREPASQMDESGSFVQQVAKFFVRLAGKKPLLLYGKHLQRCDDFSRRVISELSDRFSEASSRLFIILESRPGKSLEFFRRETRLELIGVKALAQEDFDSALDVMFETSLDKRQKSRLYRQCGGNFRHLFCLLNELIGTGKIKSGEESGTMAMTAGEIPRSATSFERQWVRINTLSRFHRKIIFYSALCSAEGVRKILEQVLDCSEDKLGAALEQLAEAQYLRLESGEIDFRQNELRRAVLELLPRDQFEKIAAEIIDVLKDRPFAPEYRKSLAVNYRRLGREVEFRRRAARQVFKLLSSWRLQEARALINFMESENWLDNPDSPDMKPFQLQIRAFQAEYYEKNLSGAQRHQEQAVQFLRENNIQRELAEALPRLARLAIKQDDFELVEWCVDEGLELAEKHEWDEIRARHHFVKAWGFEKQRLFPEALEEYKKAMFWETEPVGDCYPLGGLARVNGRLGQLERGRILAKQVIYKFSWEQWFEMNPHLYGLNLGTYGLQLGWSGKYERAFDFLTTALVVGIRTWDRVIVQLTLRRLAHLCELIDCPDRAAQFQRLAEQRGYPWRNFPAYSEAPVDAQFSTHHQDFDSRFERIDCILAGSSPGDDELWKPARQPFLRAPEDSAQGVESA